MKLHPACAFLLAPVLLLASPAAPAQSYPARQLTLVSTAPAGGSIDAVARMVAADLSGVLGRPVIVDTKPGAGGNIAAAFVAKSDPDGHTLLITASSTLTINPHIYKSLGFDPEASFVPIVSPAAQNLILVVHPKHGVASVQQFIALLNARPGRLNFGSGGTGNLQHLAGEVFGMETGTRANHIPYKGAAPALNDLLAGETDYMFDSATSVSHVKAGKLRALAVVGPGRMAALPEVATFRELGVPGMEAARGYYAILAPAGTPQPIVQRLNAEIVRILRTPVNMDRVAAIGLDPHSTTPEELAAALREDRARFGRVVKQANISAQ
jgi:tripartite-type tricarboxylate transporter receptor subunit TctC